MNDILYDKNEADALTESEKTESWRHEGEKLKAKLIIEHTNNIDSFWKLVRKKNSSLSSEEIFSSVYHIVLKKYY